MSDLQDILLHWQHNSFTFNTFSLKIFQETDHNMRKQIGMKNALLVTRTAAMNNTSSFIGLTELPTCTNNRPVI